MNSSNNKLSDEYSDPSACAEPGSELIAQVKRVWPFERWREFNVVVAVSGGSDSVFLLRVLAKIFRDASSKTAKTNLIVAHFNHRTRGEESDRDQEFVRKLAQDLDFKFVSGNMEANKDASEVSTGSNSSEEAFRNARYDFFIDVARKHQARYIVLGHHAQDQIETILFRLFRGTGVPGLTGIPAQRLLDESITIVRPLLEIDPQNIRNALEAWGQDFRVDASNAESDYSRNFLRNEVVPKIKSRFGSKFEAAVLRLGRQAAEQQEFLLSQVEPLMAGVRFEQGSLTEVVQIDCDRLVDCHVVLIRELLSEIWNRQRWDKSQMSFVQFDQVAKLIADSDAAHPGFHLPGKISCRKAGQTLFLSNELADN